jgi:hypothetical protein
MTDKRDTRLTLNFSIEEGVVFFDIINGDGADCEALASVFTQDTEILELGHKPEYNKAHKGPRHIS